MLAFTWGEFVFWVAVSVVAGLIVVAIAGLVAWAWRQRGKRKRKQYQRYIDRTGYRAALVGVAGELRADAEVAERCEEGSHVPSEVGHLGTIEWKDRRNELMPLRDEDSPLWEELEEAYAALQVSKQRGGYPPKSTDLLSLADRLDGKLEREGKPPKQD